MSDPAEPADLSPRRFRLAVVAVLVAHLAALAWLAFWAPWTRDELAYLRAGATLRQELRWDVFHTTFHGPLPFFANQTFAWLVPIDPADGYKAWGRLGMLPFALLAALALTGLTRAAFGRRVALFALLLHACCPVVLANAPLMTCDMALAAFYLLAVALAWHFLCAPGWPALLLLGAAGGLALATKYLALFLVPALALCAVAAWAGGFRPQLLWSQRRATRAAAAADLALGAVVAATAALLALHTAYLWAAGGYSVRRPPDGVALPPQDPRAGPLSAALQAALRWPGVESLLSLLPDPFVRGVDFQKLQSERAGLTPFAGRFAAGHPAYFVVSLATKLPLATLALTALGAVVRRPAWPRRLRPLLLFAAGVPLAYLSLASVLQNGVRNLLPILPLLALVAARGAEALWRRGRAGRTLLALLAAALLACHAITWPRYTSAFNVLAGTRPYLLFTDSNLDWSEREPRDGDLLLARHPGAERLVAGSGPRFGRVVICGAELAPADPRHPDRVHHWLRRFTPVDRLGAWFAFDVDEAAFDAADDAATPRATAELATALLAVDPARAGRLASGLDDADAPLLATAATALSGDLPAGAPACHALLRLGRADLVLRPGSGATPTQRAQAHWQRREIDAAIEGLRALEGERRLEGAEVALLAGALAARGDDDAALAVLDRYRPADGDPALATWQSIRARFAESARTRRRLGGH